MEVKGGELKVIPTSNRELGAKLIMDNFNNFNSEKLLNYFPDNMIKEIVRLDNSYDSIIGTGSTYKVLGKYTTGAITLYTTKNNYNQLYSAEDYFEELKSEGIEVAELKRRATLANQLDLIFHIKFRDYDAIVSETALTLALIIADLTDGAINSLGLNAFPDLEQRTYSVDSWERKIEYLLLHRL